MLGLLYPAQCPCCGRIVENSPDSRAHAALCPECWQDAHFITDPACLKCGAPLPENNQADAAECLCDDCLSIARPWHRGRAALVYSGTGRILLLALKHRDRPDLAPVLGAWLSEAARPIITPDMIVAPVPLHFRRLFKRRYNQSALLARHLGALHGLTVIPDLLLRKRHTPMQDHRNITDRFANIANAITVNPRRLPHLGGRPVLLVDDVMTSGATLSAATEALHDAGSGRICVASLARALKDD
ncbi:ComF family protein [Paracoccus onubensis]|uniref:ComF family protein n=1 Tax=Paracoccus onubensis TaxID=1675788 RepID=UPI00272F1EAC|nr:ComF family protein [Paracoccus onubensis]MDP0927094.1 ComF family protein [Paracoccus onubensis]